MLTAPYDGGRKIDRDRRHGSADYTRQAMARSGIRSRSAHQRCHLHVRRTTLRSIRPRLRRPVRHRRSYRRLRDPATNDFDPIDRPRHDRRRPRNADYEAGDVRMVDDPSRTPRRPRSLPRRSTRRLLTPLARLAAKYGVVSVLHLNKKVDSRAIAHGRRRFRNVRSTVRSPTPRTRQP